MVFFNTISKNVVEAMKNRRIQMEIEELAKEHWEYTRKICELMYLEAFKHGYKHGKRDGSND